MAARFLAISHARVEDDFFPELSISELVEAWAENEGLVLGPLEDRQAPLRSSATQDVLRVVLLWEQAGLACRTTRRNETQEEQTVAFLPGCQDILMCDRPVNVLRELTC